MDRVKSLYQESLDSFRAGHLEEAILKLEEARSVQPNHPDVLEALGVFYSKADRIDDAIGVMKHLAVCVPDHMMAHTNLSRFYVEKGMILEAEKEQAEARRLSWKAELKSQKESTGRKGKEKSAEDIKREHATQLKDQIERYRRVIGLDPADVLGYFTLGTVLLDSDDVSEAIQTLRQAVRVDPKHSPSYFLLGVALERRNQEEEAIQIYSEGIKVADQKGDMVPLRKMEARLRVLRST
ncbi:MAG: hypothetical protein A3A73_01400 [Omnitrophica bacterium RIFCSPLOWO2_01_FULL_50_24]|nr:MAG: hypothetical protein A3A73_01400 [Omnitrophica bacterium RIFCSPLOWO2_01_FULL_50_24]